METVFKILYLALKNISKNLKIRVRDHFIVQNIIVIATNDPV